eukprot:1013133-Pyramimonas_sp.AAC.1
MRCCNASVDHTFSCEIDANVQTFIKAFACPKRLFADVTSFLSERPFDLLSQKCAAVPPSTLIFQGFVCKDLSYMNQKAGEAAALAP